MSIEGSRCKLLWVHTFHIGQQPGFHPCCAGSPFGQQSWAISERHRLGQQSPFPPALLHLPSDFSQERYLGVGV